MGAGAAIVGAKRVDAAEPDRRVAGNQDDERGSELLDRARTGQRPDAELLEQRCRPPPRAAGRSASSSGRTGRMAGGTGWRPPRRR